MSAKDDLALVAAWREVRHWAEHDSMEAGDAIADRLEEIATVDNPCPECGENTIPLQIDRKRWSCKNHHLQVRS